MAGRLRGVRAVEVIRALEKAAFVIDRQRGSHVTLRNVESKRTIVVPVHTREFPRWLLKKIIKDAGLTEAEFRELL